MSNLIRAISLLSCIALLLGCTPGAVTVQRATPSPMVTSTPSPTPPRDVGAFRVEVQEMLDEAATLDFSLQGEAVAEALALYLARPDRDEFFDWELAEEFQTMMDDAGLEIFIGVSLVELDTEPKTYIGAYGYSSLRIFWGGIGHPLQNQEIAFGDVVNEARLVEGELGVIFAVVGASTVTPDFLLLRQENEAWASIWPLPEGPTPWRDIWITADGEVFFGADDLPLIRTVGSSWGVAFMEEDPFFECHACAHRYFEILWERQADLYIPQVSLPQDAPYYERLWEVTRPSFYASLFEFLRRLRAGDEVGAAELVVDPAVIDQAKALGLDDSARSFLSDFPDMPAHGMVFVFYENDEDFLPQYEASFQLLTAEQEHWLIDGIRQIEPED
ncbi:MAG: hypothetical protein HYX86_00295 [Chloroflexi bacterium]|nr:hypothetical protein [Chloroflexota bacterium]